MNTPPPQQPAAPTGADDPRCIPLKLTAPIPIGDDCPYPNYTALEHATWAQLYARQEMLLPGRAADEYLAGLQRLGLDREKIPALAAVSRKLKAATGWRIARTPGLLDAGDFFAYLSQRVFPCTDYIRSQSELDYTPAPDCFHDIFGHTPMIMHPRFADFYQKIGLAAVACRDPVVMEALTRNYWFTVEFGLIQGAGGPRIYGNGIISSYGETIHSLTGKTSKRPYVPEAAGTTPYDIWHFQEQLFVIKSFDDLERLFEDWARSHSLL